MLHLPCKCVCVCVYVCVCYYYYYLFIYCMLHHVSDITCSLSILIIQLSYMY
jgi:hypothetical protein